LHELLEVLAVGRSRVGDVVVGEPALQLRLVPLVVCFDVTSVNFDGEGRY
jgi:hypothetical protein